ncbi:MULTISPECIES: cytochrome P450 family protein [Streptomyces]|uniref:Cytochrome n=2 Tax=Streptomyces TaxID=1883 RepID=A0A101Q4A6_STRCK|nr:cytochrome P450 [Streptomyces corchorusii]AEY87625.1 putative cytochrome P450 [Streptomyces hygroscopicus subsp. jinggangensis 5008]AGF61781.1 putative cytochrome P450 [Streptomyces hygroscopicus subsp. jinggangensis TL01]KUN23117.1 cytochrome [Streptomyces corchorusii]
MTTTHEAVAAAERCTPEFRRDPHAVYAHLRDSAPVCPMRPPHGNETYLVTRYDDARAALSDPRLSKDMYGAMDAYRRIFGDSSVALDDNMLNSDAPKHTRLRRLVNSAFTPRRVEALRPRIEEIVRDLLDECPARERFDLLPAFAFPLPIIVICDLLGVPPEDRTRMQHLSTTVAQTGFGEEAKRAQQQAEEGLHAYFTDLLTAKRERPGDDLLSALIAARDNDGGLTESELVSTAFLLMFAGHKTTAYLIGNAVHHLLSHPAQLRAVREDPELIRAAVEELVRYDGSVESATFRYATEDVEYGGTLIPKGALVQIAISSANRDPRKFDAPDELDVRRPGNAQDAHLGFGHGSHYCLGAPLARLETQLALTRLFERFPRMALADPAGAPRWLEVPFPAFRGLAELPVVLDPAG